MLYPYHQTVVFETRASVPPQHVSSDRLKIECSSECKVSIQCHSVTISSLRGRAHKFRPLFVGCPAWNIESTKFLALHNWQPPGSCIHPEAKSKQSPTIALHRQHLWLLDSPVCGLCRAPALREGDGMIALFGQVLLPQAARARRWRGCLLPPAFWASGRKTLGGPARFIADVCGRLHAEASDSLKEVQRKNEQLRVQLSKSLAKPKLQWRSYGQSARNAAQLLAPRPGVSLEGLATATARIHPTLSASSGDTTQEIQRKNKGLRKELLKTPWPRLKCFAANGCVHSLPLRAVSREPSHRPAKARLKYLAGFFDGDGSVSCVTNLSGCQLKVSQSYDQAEVFMLFREAFGGSIVSESDGMGLGKPVLQWLACGPSARRAAELLAPHSITKQRQLLLAAEWPEAKSRREECKAELRALKEYDSAVSGPSSWEYCAGFFDAEGHIHQLRGGASLVLEIKQKHPRVLLCLRELFVQSLGKEATLAKSRESLHALWVCGLASCKQILQHLLAAGLLCKAKQAELAVGLTRENAPQVDAELGHLTGNQMFGKKLDAAGRERAKKISAARSQAFHFRKGGQLIEACAKMSEVKVLEEEHELLKACLENQQLMEYAGKLQNLHLNSWDGPFADGM